MKLLYHPELRNAYEEALRDFRIAEALSISKAFRPDRLYRYRSYDTERFKEELGGSLYFSAPSKFNDPLDSRWFVNYERVISDRLTEIGANSSEVCQFVRPLRQVYEEDVSWPMQDNCFVCCLSETPRSNPMWGNYADEHKGYCVEYDVKNLDVTGVLVMPVVYSSTPLDASRLIDERIPLGTIAPLLFKDESWSYEHEWRIIQPRATYGDDCVGAPRCFGQKAVTGVYVGLRREAILFHAAEAVCLESGIVGHQIERSYMSYELTSSTFEEMRSGEKAGLYP